MGKARYLVILGDPDGARSEITVWADSPFEASTQAKLMELYATRAADSPAPISVRRIGRFPAKGDLNVATSWEDMNWRSFDAQGREASTPVHPEPSEFERFTRVMRSSEAAGWTWFRSRLRDRGLDPDRCAYIDPVPEEGPAAAAVVVSADRKAFVFRYEPEFPLEARVITWFEVDPDLWSRQHEVAYQLLQGEEGER